MKILHTADWHIGQLFHEYDRAYEHQQFLNWLVATIKEQSVDILLVSGDVFDNANPSAASVKMFYTFLNNALKAQPHLQIIVTAGNHDSASRLESPKPLLESSNIHIIGIIERNTDGSFNYEKLCIPIHDKQGNICLWIMAIPFLRMGDYPTVADSTSPYTDGVMALYQEAYEYTLTQKQAGQAILAMGHLHAMHAEVSDHDNHERLIMGGVEFVPVTTFHENIVYTALGHIHKAQRIGGRENVRYSGSPLPMSFSELNYKHQVVAFEVIGEEITHIQSIEVPLAIPLLRVPSSSKQLAEVLNKLQQLPPVGDNLLLAPYLEVRVLLNGPEPALRHKIEAAIEGKNVRLTKIDVKYPDNKGNVDGETAIALCDKLHELNPFDVFARIYQSKYNNPAPDVLVVLFNQVLEKAMDWQGES
ncbi:exonuclease SbcCD subunit D C-terminal domain-containing protein [Parasediminibacterium sp. JCM 36343]|uniref:exonuclease SbcCD subunit D C-terminal domain-containing protein n=1 Tax=Parasediminibacterium sp. JCM 36343 TaxID=3374279 RepID=UPI00397D1FB9